MEKKSTKAELNSTNSDAKRSVETWKTSCGMIGERAFMSVP